MNGIFAEPKANFRTLGIISRGKFQGPQNIRLKKWRILKKKILPESTRITAFFAAGMLSKNVNVYFLFHLREGSGNQVHINRLIFLTKFVQSTRENVFLITGLD